MRKELNFCVKTKTNIIGVVENMSGFTCSNCKVNRYIKNKCTTEIFSASTGGAAKMCEEFNVKLLAKIPIEPELMKSCDQGKCFATAFPDSITAKSFTSVWEEIKKITKN